MKKDFYQLLKKKLDLGKKPEVEERFLQNFKNEFGEEEESSFGLLAGLTSATAMLAITFLIFRGSYFNINDDELVIAAIIQNEVLLSNMDMLDELDDIELTDEEWDMLLEETI